MKKEPYRDYATAAIIAWSAAGCPSAEESRKRFRGAEYADMAACARAFDNIRLTLPDACTAALLIYVPGRMGKGELTGRVERFAMEHYLSERQVWERLAKVRKEFAKERGLRV